MSHPYNDGRITFLCHKKSCVVAGAVMIFNEIHCQAAASAGSSLGTESALKVQRSRPFRDGHTDATIRCNSDPGDAECPMVPISQGRSLACNQVRN